jgi:hypothetical protein
MKPLNLVVLTLFSGISATSLIAFDFKASASELNPTNVGCTEDTKDTGVLGRVSGLFGRQEITPKYCTSAAVPSGVTFEDEKQTRNSDGTIKFEFKAFNKGSAAALVEVYDSNKKIVDAQVIDGNKPPTGFLPTTKALLLDVPAITISTKYPLTDIRRNLKEQNISVTIPAGGYVTITKSSNVATWYNTTIFAFEVASLVKGDSESSKSEPVKQMIKNFAKEVGKEAAINIFTGTPTIQSAFSQELINKERLADVLTKLIKYSLTIESDPSKNPILSALAGSIESAANSGAEALIGFIVPGLDKLVKSVSVTESGAYIAAKSIDLLNAIAYGKKATVTLTDSVKVAQPKPPKSTETSRSNLYQNLPLPVTSGVDTYVGIWKGRGVQFNNGSRWSILITLARGEGDSVVGTMEYPSLACGGQLTLRRVNTQSIELAENLTYGRCVNRGTVTLQKVSSDQLQYKWYFSDGKLGATGTVQKVAQSEPPKSTNISRQTNNSGVTIQSVAKSVNWMDANAISSNTVTRFVGRAEVVFSDGNKRTFYNNAFAVWGLGGIVIDNERLVIIPDNSNVCVLQNPEALRYLTSYRAYTNIVSELVPQLVNSCRKGNLSASTNTATQPQSEKHPAEIVVTQFSRWFLEYEIRRRIRDVNYRRRFFEQKEAFDPELYQQLVNGFALDISIDGTFVDVNPFFGGQVGTYKIEVRSVKPSPQGNSAEVIVDAYLGLRPNPQSQWSRQPTKILVVRNGSRWQIKNFFHLRDNRANFDLLAWLKNFPKAKSTIRTSSSQPQSKKHPAETVVTEQVTSIPNVPTWNQFVKQGGNRYIQVDYDLPDEFRNGYIYFTQGASVIYGYIFKSGLSNYPPKDDSRLPNFEIGDRYVNSGQAIRFFWNLGNSGLRYQNNEVRFPEKGTVCLGSSCLRAPSMSNAQISRILRSRKSISKS